MPKPAPSDGRVPLIIRPAAETDIMATAEVASRAYRASFAAILDPAALAARTPDFFAARFENVLPQLRIALKEQAVLGCALMTNRHIDMLFVDPSAQRAGVGRALLARLEAEGARSLECFRSNFIARAFYESHGWHVDQTYSRPFAGAKHQFVRYEKDARHVPG